MASSPTMSTSLVMEVVKYFSDRVETERSLLDRLDRNGARLSGDRDTGTGFGSGLVGSLPASNFPEFRKKFNDACTVSLGRAFQGGLWPAIEDLWMPRSEIDGYLFRAAFDEASKRAAEEYYPPIYDGTVLEAFATAAQSTAGGKEVWLTISSATEKVRNLASISRDPGVYVVLYFLESFGEVGP